MGIIVHCQKILAIFSIVFAIPMSAYAWTDQTHMAIARAAGLKGFHNACAADVSHTIAYVMKLHVSESAAHYFDASEPPSRTDVEKQLTLIGKSKKKSPNGYLLGAIIHMTREAKKATAAGKFDDYHYAILAHYVGDLAQPLHVSVYDSFSRKNHKKTDMILDDKNAVWDIDGAITLSRKLKVDDTIHFTTEDDIIEHMLLIANESYELGNNLRRENRLMTKDEAMQRASSAAGFLRALIKYCGKSFSS